MGIAHAAVSVTFPAQFALVAAMNPCADVTTTNGKSAGMYKAPAAKSLDFVAP